MNDNRKNEVQYAKNIMKAGIRETNKGQAPSRT